MYSSEEDADETESDNNEDGSDCDDNEDFIDYKIDGYHPMNLGYYYSINCNSFL